MNISLRRIAGAVICAVCSCIMGCVNDPGFKGSLKTADGQTISSRRIIPSRDSCEVVVDEKRKLVVLDMAPKDGTVPALVAMTLPWQARGKMAVGAGEGSEVHAWMISPATVAPTGGNWDQAFHEFLTRFVLLNDVQRSEEPGIVAVTGNINVETRTVEPGDDFDITVSLKANDNGPWIDGRFERATLINHKEFRVLYKAPLYVLGGHYVNQ